jgi:hypothetical protein
MFTQAIVTLLFVILAVAVIGWIGFISSDLKAFLKSHRVVSGIVQTIFNAAPVQQEATKAAEPVKIVVKDIIPLLFWLLILLPMFIFPIILIIFPLMHIPWAYLLPPTG